MIVSQKTATHPVLLVNYFQNREQKWYRGTHQYSLPEGPNLRQLLENQDLQGLLAENALVQSCQEREIWVI